MQCAPIPSPPAAVEAEISARATNRKSRAAQVWKEGAEEAQPPAPVAAQSQTPAAAAKT